MELADHRQAVLDRREHAEPEQVELDQPDLGAVVLVPLQHGASRHASPLDRAHLDDRTVAHHHAAGVNPQVPRRILQFAGELDHLRRDRLRVVLVSRRPVVALLDLFAPRVLLSLRVAEGPRDVAHRRLRPVGDDVRDLRGVLAAVHLVDVLDDLFATVGLDVDVDVRRLAALGREEPLEHQLVEDGVDGGDAQRVADRGVRGGSPSLGEDSVLAAELRDLPHDEEVAGEVQVFDDLEFVLDHRSCSVGVRLCGRTTRRSRGR